jgi:hypothetical protein
MANILDELRAEMANLQADLNNLTEQLTEQAYITFRNEYRRYTVDMRFGINTQVYQARRNITSVVCSKLDMQEEWRYFFDTSGNIIIRKKDGDNDIVVSFLNQLRYGNVLFEISSYGQDSAVCYNVDGLIDEVNRRLESYEP